MGRQQNDWQMNCRFAFYDIFIVLASFTASPQLYITLVPKSYE